MPIMDTRQQIIQQVMTGLLAAVLLGGTVALLLLGQPVPEFLVGFDGVIVTAAFANGAFFVQARTAQPTANALATAMQMHHDLAIAAMSPANPPSNGTTVPETTSATSEASK